MRSTDTNGCDVSFFEKIDGGGGIFIAKVESLMDEIDLGIFMCSSFFELHHELGLFLIALLTDSIFLVILEEMISRGTLIAFYNFFILHAKIKEYSCYFWNKL